MKTSNKFTLSRILLAPVFFLLYFVPLWTGNFLRQSAYVMIPLLACMEITDFFDGFFARLKNEVSDFGKVFDPFADVVVHMMTFTCFMFSVGGTNGAYGAYMHPLIFLLILFREFTMNFCRMTAAKKGVAIAARKGGKVKTVLYVVAGFFALLLESMLRLGIQVDVMSQLHTVAVILFVLCAVASYASFADYVVHFKKLFVE